MVGRSATSACSQYAARARAQFNYKPGKTAIMPILSNPVGYSEVDGVQIRDEHMLLGVLVDSGLTFSSCLESIVRRGKAIFGELLQTAETEGFSIPVVAAQVPIRVEPVVLYAAALLALASEAETSLNRLQFFWARHILGCNQGCALNWNLCILQCGWNMRLGTRMWEFAIVARARLFLMPPESPAARIFQIALHCTCPTWVLHVANFMTSSSLPETIPEIWSMSGISVAKVTKAQGDNIARKDLLRRYRMDVVRPILLQRDRIRFASSAQADLPCIMTSFARLQPLAAMPDQGLLGWEFDRRTWRHYRCWAVVRISGRWPLAVLGASDCPQSLEFCRLCGTPDVDVCHALCECRGTSSLYDQLRVKGACPDRDRAPACTEYIFGMQQERTEFLARVTFTGSAIAACATSGGGVFS